MDELFQLGLYLLKRPFENGPHYRVWWGMGKFGPYRTFTTYDAALAFYKTRRPIFYPYIPPSPEPPGKGVTWWPGQDYTAYPSLQFVAAPGHMETILKDGAGLPKT